MTHKHVNFVYRVHALLMYFHLMEMILKYDICMAYGSLRRSEYKTSSTIESHSRQDTYYTSIHRREESYHIHVHNTDFAPAGSNCILFNACNQDLTEHVLARLLHGISHYLSQGKCVCPIHRWLDILRILMTFLVIK